MFSSAIIIMMPLIATVAGVKIYMYFKDHNPPHFHARDNGEEEVFDLKGNSMHGSIESRKSGKVGKWAGEKEKFLKDKWDELQK